MKVCTKCEKEKPFDEFRKSSRYEDGRYSRCKECMKEYEKGNERHEKKLVSRRKYRENNREKIRHQDRESYSDNPDKFREKAKIAQRKYYRTEKGQEKYKKEGERLRKLYPKKARARSLLSNAIVDGKIIRPSICSACRTEGRVEAHHPDYSKPYDVIWVCKSCHFMIHRKIKSHRERLSPETPKGDAIVQTREETTREESEAVLPPS